MGLLEDESLEVTGVKRISNFKSERSDHKLQESI